MAVVENLKTGNYSSKKSYLKHGKKCFTIYFYRYNVAYFLLFLFTELSEYLK